MTTVKQTSIWTARHSAWLAGILLVQFSAAFLIGSGHLLTNDQHSVMAPIAATALFPVAVSGPNKKGGGKLGGNKDV